MNVEPRKTPFVWVEPQLRLTVPDRLNFHCLEESNAKEFVTALSLCLATSLDRYDQARVKEFGAEEVARQCFEQVEADFVYQRQWWQLAYKQAGELVGFVQPVIFRGCQREGLEEGTIYHIGVLPAHRGHNYGCDLLSKATAILQDVGVWRIFADADTLNIPMLKTFVAVGYEHFSPS